MDPYVALENGNYDREYPPFEVGDLVVPNLDNADGFELAREGLFLAEVITPEHPTDNTNVQVHIHIHKSPRMIGIAPYWYRHRFKKVA